MGDLAPEDELAAALRARHQLGEEYERAVVESFVERIQKRIDARVDQRVEERLRAGRQASRGQRRARMTVALVSVAVAFPMAAVTVSSLHDVSAAAALLAEGAILVSINLAYRQGH